MLGIVQVPADTQINARKTASWRAGERSNNNNNLAAEKKPTIPHSYSKESAVRNKIIFLIVFILLPGSILLLPFFVFLYDAAELHGTEEYTVNPQTYMAENNNNEIPNHSDRLPSTDILLVQTPQVAEIIRQFV